MYPEPVRLAWDANPAEDRVSGYKVFWGAKSYNYCCWLDVGLVTETGYIDIPVGNYINVKAYRHHTAPWVFYWDLDESAEGYIFYWGSEPGVYTDSLDVGLVTSAEIPMPVNSHYALTYYYTDADGNRVETDYSPERYFAEYIESAYAEEIQPAIAPACRGSINYYFIENDVSHEDLIFFWDCQSDSAKGGSNLGSDIIGTKTNNGSYVGDGIISNYYDNVDNTSYISFASGGTFNHSEGTIALCVRPQTSLLNDNWFGVGANGSNFIHLYEATDSTFRASFNFGGTIEYLTSSATYTIDKWYWVVLRWKDGEFAQIWVAGVLEDHQTAMGTWNGGSIYGDIYFGSNHLGVNNSNVHIGRAFISNKADTPEMGQCP